MTLTLTFIAILGWSFMCYSIGVIRGVRYAIILCNKELDRLYHKNMVEKAEKTDISS